MGADRPGLEEIAQAARTAVRLSSRFSGLEFDTLARHGVNVVGVMADVSVIRLPSTAIEIADNGVGMARATDSDCGDEIGFGLTIVDLLGRQLRARVDRSDAAPGVRVTLELPLE